MDTIIISDLEVQYHIGVPDAERARPQRLLISLGNGPRPAAPPRRDDLAHTLNYDAICQRLKTLGTGAAGS